MILSANWASPAQQAVVIVTDDRGPVLVTTEADQQALDAWIADGGTVGPVPVTAAQVIAERDRRMESLASAYTPTERETWHVQIKEAEAFLADANAATPMLTPIAQARGVTVAQMAQHVLGLQAAFAAASGAILAAARVLTDSDPIPDDYKDNKHWP